MSGAPEDGFERLERLEAAAGHFPEVAWFLNRIELWVADDSPRPLKLQRYLKLPSTPLKRRHYLRNRWLARAAAEVGVLRWPGAVKLAKEMGGFLSCGTFARWREQGGPPENASRLRSALYHALALNDSRSLSPDRLVQIEIVSSAFIEKFDASSPTMSASESFEDTDAS